VHKDDRPSPHRDNRPPFRWEDRFAQEPASERAPAEPSAFSTASHDEFVEALRGGDLERSDRLLGDLRSPLPEYMLLSVAELHILRERWSDAAYTLAGIPDQTPEIVMRRRLCRNLAALQHFRPQVYKVLADAEAADSYQLIQSRTGPMTVAFRHDNGRTTILSADNDPPGAVRKVMAQIDDALAAGKPLGLAGIGDGYLLYELAHHPPNLILGREQAVCLFEPDPRLALACLMLHDYTGPDGPIEQGRFLWFVGDRWAEHFHRDFRANLMLGYPQVTIRLGLRSAEIDRELAKFLESVSVLDKQFVGETQAYYARLTRDELLKVLGPQPSRPPRVLVITTRFSTVLQFSARDTADAFTQLGCNAKLLIEDEPWQGMSRIAIRQAIAEFKPDLVFQIDHLRSEYGDMFPATLPSVCWVQDNLPNLTNATAAAGVQPREFVLIPSAQRYIANYGYPARRCLEFRKLTRIPERPATWNSDGDDLVYVSNWSQEPQSLAAEIVRDLGRVMPQDVIDLTCRRMIDIYADGGSLPTQGDVRRVLETVQQERRTGLFAEELQRTAIAQLFERMNNCLFRQQGIAWAAQIADRYGLTLSLYGNGWAEHPQYSQYARGYAGYGRELEELTRRAKINLVLEPYVCISHQRLLDALVAGGFLLIRSHPQHALLERMIAILAELPAGTTLTATDALVSLPAPLRRELQALLEETTRADATPGRVDPITILRELQAAGFLPTQGALLPRLDEVSFDSPAQLERRVLGFLRSAEDRRAIAEAQREVIERTYSYAAGVRRIIDFVRMRLAEETALKVAG
jgi:hypothetical protein